MTRKQINRENHCPNFALSDLGDVETGKQYSPRGPYRKHDKPSIRAVQISDWIE